ncbi:MAG: tetratricopeptide repeat protein, partial [Gemmatimonadaceae bacterium]
MTVTASQRQTARRIDDDDSIADWFRTHGRKVAYVAFGAAAAAVAVYMWRQSAAIKSQRAEEGLLVAARSFASGNKPLAQTDLEKLITRYGGTEAAVQGRLLLAQILYEQNSVDSGLAVLDAAGRSDVFAASIHSLRAIGLEQGRKPAEAGAAYERAAA